jgi:hypothetical protein
MASWNPSRLKKGEYGSAFFKGMGYLLWTPIRAAARIGQFGLNAVGDTFSGIKKMKRNFNPKKRTMPRNRKWAENYKNTTNTRNTFRGRSKSKDEKSK